MAEGDGILKKADSLIQRYRVFVAGGVPTVPPETSPADGDDLPVLTEVVGPQEQDASPASESATLSPDAVAEPTDVPVMAPERVESLARELLFARLPTQRQALAEELAAWLDDELPHVVLRVLDGVTDQIIAQVTAEARAVLLPRLQVAIEEQSRSSRDAD